MHPGSPLLSVLYVFAAALVSATVLARLKQPNIIGYLIGGMLIGPFGLRLVPYENVELLAEIGIGLLMFTIGVELSVAQLLRVRNVAVFGGSLIVFILTLLCLALSGLFKWSCARRFPRRAAECLRFGFGIVLLSASFRTASPDYKFLRALQRSSAGLT